MIPAGSAIYIHPDFRVLISSVVIDKFGHFKIEKARGASIHFLEFSMIVFKKNKSHSLIQQFCSLPSEYHHK